MDTVLEQVRAELADAADETTRQGFQRFFKEPVRCYGVKTPKVAAIARAHWAEVRDGGKAGLFDRCEDLFSTGYCEEAFVAAHWLPRCRDRFEREDLARFGTWVDAYIDNWATCDTFCNHAVGDLLARFPDAAGDLMTWARSPNRWMRRAAAVSLIVPVKHGAFLGEAVAIADLLLLDSDDIVRKGYGWLLKEASRHHRQEVYDYVLGHRAVMPRTALRYAIELMPAEMRKEAVRRD